MGLIVKDYTVSGNRSSATVRALYDTGAGASLVRGDIAENLGDSGAVASPIMFTMADGQEAFTVDQTISPDVDVDGTRLQYAYYGAEDMAEELIIGADMMQRWKINLDLDNESVSMDPRALYLRV